MIQPPGGIPSLTTINYPAIVQPEIESVALLGGRACIGALCTPPRDELALVFENQCPRLDIGECEDTTAMYGGTANDDTAHTGIFETAINGRIRGRTPLRP